MSINWLPQLVCLSDYQGDWDKYFQAIYSIFHSDFVASKPTFRGVRLRLKRHPEHDGKSATFWHMISEGRVEEERTPDLRRCERIAWPRPIIENSTDTALKVWCEQRKGAKRIHIWLEDEGYLVVLDDRGKFILPWTAYYVERKHERAKLNRRFQRFGQLI